MKIKMQIVQDVEILVVNEELDPNEMLEGFMNEDAGDNGNQLEMTAALGGHAVCTSFVTSRSGELVDE